MHRPPRHTLGVKSARKDAQGAALPAPSNVERPPARVIFGATSTDVIRAPPTAPGPGTQTRPRDPRASPLRSGSAEALPPRTPIATSCSPARTSYRRVLRYDRSFEPSGCHRHRARRPSRSRRREGRPRLAKQAGADRLAKHAGADRLFLVARPPAGGRLCTARRAVGRTAYIRAKPVPTTASAVRVNRVNVSCPGRRCCCGCKRGGGTALAPDAAGGRNCSGFR